jgi:hypothetical protein
MSELLSFSSDGQHYFIVTDCSSIQKCHRIFGSKEKSLTQEELKARKDEENLFSELPKVPAILFNVTELPECNQNDEPELVSSKKSRTGK